MYRLTMQHLRCIIPEELNGDECRLDTYIDDVPGSSYRKHLDQGRTWSIGKNLTFGHHVTLRLWDEDPAVDDLLGVVTIGNNAVQGASGIFSGDGAFYMLQYEVKEIDDVPPDPVERAMSNFRESNDPACWAIQKDDLLDQIQSRLERPQIVDQDDQPFCGPSAIVYELASRFPAKYVRVCHTLYENGFFSARGNIVRASATLRDSQVPADMDDVDWMLMATLREAENVIYDDLTNMSSQIAGITLPGEMRGWSQDLLGFPHAHFESTFVFGELDAIKQADKIHKGGGAAFLLMDAAMLGADTGRKAYANHWAPYLGKLEIVPKEQFGPDTYTIQFECQCWGKVHRVGPLDEETFEDYMYGVVLAS